MTFARTTASLVVPLALLGLAFGSFGGTGCGSSDDDADASANNPGANAEALFRQIEPSLVNRCGAKDGVCHIKGVYNDAPKWLAEPDHYASIKGFRGILPITGNVADSTILTQAKHDGPSLLDPELADLKAKVTEWVQAEVGPNKLPATLPFVVQAGANTIDLKDVRPELAGSTLEFVADVTGGILNMTAIRLHAAPNVNVSIDAPFFVQIPKGARVTVDPKNAGFEGKLDVPAGTRKTFYKGELVLLHFNQDTQLKLVFGAVSTTPGKGEATECTALDVFKSAAVPAFKTFIDTIPDPQNEAGASDAATPTAACVSCHTGGEDDPDSAVAVEFVATQAMDLRGIDTDDKTACTQARRWIDFANKENSLLLTNPQGKGNTLHPLKGVPSNHPVVEGIRKWVMAEQK
jgi:hypothetical protein